MPGKFIWNAIAGLAGAAIVAATIAAIVGAPAVPAEESKAALIPHANIALPHVKVDARDSRILSAQADCGDHEGRDGEHDDAD